MYSKLYTVNVKDFIKGVTMAILVAVVTFLYSLVTQAGFDLFATEWQTVFNQMTQVSFITFISYLFKNYISDDSGMPLGIGK